jgi:hypothetical protein
MSQSLSDYAVGLADVSVGKFIAASKTPSMDVWNGWLLNENADGSILLRKVVDDKTSHFSATLPLSPLGSALRSAGSADGRLSWRYLPACSRHPSHLSRLLQRLL